MRNCSLRAISPFPTVFSKCLFPRGVKGCHCVGMGKFILNQYQEVGQKPVHSVMPKKRGYHFSIIHHPMLYSLKAALQILGRKFYKNTTKSSLYSQGLLIFIHKTLLVENHPTTGEIKELLQPRSTQTGIMVYFYMSSSLIYILEIHRRSFKHSV